MAMATESAKEVASAAEQTTCPVMVGNPINKAIFTEYKGKKVYFCCPGCDSKFKADPEKYIAKLPQFNQ
ncbi:MAG: YHS domain-containing protein [Phycisphaerae bacterium]|nr:YHS domain-containing protein [Phycisphaerae bacterium]